MKKLAECLPKFTFFIIKPSQAVQLGAVIQLDFKRFFDHLPRFVEISVPIDPHEPEIIVRLRRFRRVRFDRFLKKHSGFIDQAALFCRSTIIEIKSGIDDLVLPARR